MWSEKQIREHIRAGDALTQIVKSVFRSVKIGMTEYEVRLLIRRKMRKRGLVSVDNNPIVSFGKNTAYVHHFARKVGANKLTEGSLIMIDLWGRLRERNAPFADITWMGYFGKMDSREIKEMYDLVLLSRNKGINYLQTELRKGIIPTGWEVDEEIRKVFCKHGHEEKFLHTTGHSLGLGHPHGRFPRVGESNKRPLHQNVAYSLEPALYFEGRFGIRMECNFFIDDRKKMIITTPLQRKIFNIPLPVKH